MINSGEKMYLVDQWHQSILIYSWFLFCSRCVWFSNFHHWFDIHQVFVEAVWYLFLIGYCHLLMMNLFIFFLVNFQCLSIQQGISRLRWNYMNTPHNLIFIYKKLPIFIPFCCFFFCRWLEIYIENYKTLVFILVIIR